MRLYPQFRSEHCRRTFTYCVRTVCSLHAASFPMRTAFHACTFPFVFSVVHGFRRQMFIIQGLTTAAVTAVRPRQWMELPSRDVTTSEEIRAGSGIMLIDYEDENMHLGSQHT